MCRTNRNCKIIYCFILSFLLVFCFIISTAPVSVSAHTETPRGEISHMKTYYEKNKEVLDYYYEAVMNMEETIDLKDFNLQKTEAEYINKVTRRMHPELIYLDTCKRVSDSTGKLIYVVPVYRYTKDEVEAKMIEVEKRVDEIIALTNDKMTDLEKAIIVHDEIVIGCEYSTTGKTIYDSLILGTGNCEGYTLAYAYILSRLGINTEIVVSEKMNHAWCKVCIDGKYYNADLTWDDPSPDRQVYTEHSYFLMSDDAISGENGYHYGFEDCYYKSDDTRFDNSILHDIDTKICYSNSNMYAFYNNVWGAYHKDYYKKLIKYDPNTDTAEIVKEFSYNWERIIDGEVKGRYYGNFSSLDVHNDILYYNSPAEVFMYNTKTNDIFKFDIQDVKGEYEQYYGVIIKKDSLYLATGNDPNESFNLVFAKKIPNKVFSAGVLCTKVLADEKRISVKLGDVDFDNEVMVIDATIIQKYLSEMTSFTDEQCVAADVNYDGAISIVDCTEIQKNIVGL